MLIVYSKQCITRSGTIWQWSITPGTLRLSAHRTLFYPMPPCWSVSMDICCCCCCCCCEPLDETLHTPHTHTPHTINPPNLTRGCTIHAPHRIRTAHARSVSRDALLRLAVVQPVLYGFCDKKTVVWVAVSRLAGGGRPGAAPYGRKLTSPSISCPIRPTGQVVMLGNMDVNQVRMGGNSACLWLMTKRWDGQRG